MAEERPQLPGTEQLFEEMPCGLLVTAADGTILRVNRTFCEWIGLPKEELVDRKKLQELFTMGARIFHQTHWLPMLQMQGSISEVKLDVKARGGVALPMLLNVIRRNTESGVYDEISAFIAEDRNKYERELLAARKRADSLATSEQDRALFGEQMIGIVSHDLRNPLSVVMMATRFLTSRSDHLASDQSTRMLSSIARAAEQAQRLIEDLLDFTAARIGHGMMMSFSSINLNEVVARTVEELGLAYPGRTLRHVEVGAGDVDADPYRLTQLLGNLVSNALVHGDADRPVTVTSGVANSMAQVTVHNFGAVIPPSVLSTMFDPMVRGGSQGSPTRSVGLGLFIVRAIAQAHAGSVNVHSSTEIGTKFQLTFPARATKVCT